MSDIVERLWKRAKSAEIGTHFNLLMDAAADIERLRSDLANARNAALEDASKLIEEGFDRPGIVKKQDTCAHGKFGWEDCEQCAVIAIRRLKAEGENR